MTKQHALNKKLTDALRKHSLIVCLVLSCPYFSSAQLYSNKPFFVGVSAYTGKFQVHTSKLQYFDGTHPYGLEIEAGEWLISKKIKDRYGVYAKWGILFNYVNFDHKDLGYGAGSLIYIEPMLKARGTWRFSTSLEAGVSYMSNPYHNINNTANLAYSTKIAFPLIARFRCYYFINKQMAIKASVSFRHVSNGGLKEPNLGINYPTVGLGVERVFNNYKVVPLNTVNTYSYKKKNTELLLGYSVKTDSLDKAVGNVATIFGNRSYQIAKYSAITLGGLVEYQQNNEMKSITDQLSIGACLGNEFIIGKIKFGQQLGVYAFKRKNAPNILFQHYYLRCCSDKRFLFGIGVKAHGLVADYLQIQLGYVIK